jgi:hypothetical protein
VRYQILLTVIIKDESSDGIFDLAIVSEERRQRRGWIIHGH